MALFSTFSLWVASVTPMDGVTVIGMFLKSPHQISFLSSTSVCPFARHLTCVSQRHHDLNRSKENSSPSPPKCSSSCTPYSDESHHQLVHLSILDVWLLPLLLHTSHTLFNQFQDPSIQPHNHHSHAYFSIYTATFLLWPITNS